MFAALCRKHPTGTAAGRAANNGICNFCDTTADEETKADDEFDGFGRHDVVRIAHVGSVWEGSQYLPRLSLPT